jgi:hypothetical protein
MAYLMKTCQKDADTKLLTETGDFPTALSLLQRLKERFKSTVSRQLDVAHQEFYNFALRPKEPPRQFVNRYDAMLLRVANLKKPVDEAQKISRFFAAIQATGKVPMRSLIQNLKHGSAKPKTYAEIKAAFEELELDELVPSTSTSGATLNGTAAVNFLAHYPNQQFQNKKKKKKKKSYPCTICDSHDHPSHPCPHREAARHAVSNSRSSSSQRPNSGGRLATHSGRA